FRILPAGRTCRSGNEAMAALSGEPGRTTPVPRSLGHRKGIAGAKVRPAGMQIVKVAALSEWAGNKAARHWTIAHSGPAALPPRFADQSGGRITRNNCQRPEWHWP